MWQPSRTKAFSLLELVIVAVIIGIIAAIAIPRMSRGTTDAADAALKRDLQALQSAIEIFAAEHGGAYPTLARIQGQLTQYTDCFITSDPVAKPDKDHPFGPYLQAIPKLPVGACKGKFKITGVTPPGSDTAAGWVYDEKTGVIRANCSDSEVDSQDKKYSDYGGESVLQGASTTTTP